jgi:hypothetical protein
LLARELPDGRLQLIDGHLRSDITPDMDVPVLILDITEAEADKLLATLDPLASPRQCRHCWRTWRPGTSRHFSILDRWRDWRIPMRFRRPPLRWLRVPGDTIFALGAIALVLFVAGLKTGHSLRMGQPAEPAPKELEPVP